MVYEYFLRAGEVTTHQDDFLFLSATLACISMDELFITGIYGLQPTVMRLLLLIYTA
jgi:hypothetical protein